MTTLGNGVMQGVGLGTPLQVEGVPVTGVDAIQTVTIGGTPTSGTFTLKFLSLVTAPITWSATNGTLLANVLAALEALANVDVAVADVDLAAGIGDFTVTFDGADVSERVQPDMVADGSLLVGTAPTVAVATTTAGVRPTGKGAPIGGRLIDITNGVNYINGGTEDVPDWEAVTVS